MWTERRLPLVDGELGIADVVAVSGNSSAPTNRIQRPVSRELNGERSTAVRMIRDIRSVRQDYFPPELFGEPAWDILLDLYEAKLAQFRLAVSKVCVGSSLPSTTALRWLNALEKHGFVQREQDTADGRRVFVEITPKAVEAMDSLFATIEDRLFKYNQSL